MRGRDAIPGERSPNSAEEGRSRPHPSLGQVAIVCQRIPRPSDKKRIIKIVLTLKTPTQPSRQGEEYKRMNLTVTVMIN